MKWSIKTISAAWRGVKDNGLWVALFLSVTGLFGYMIDRYVDQTRSVKSSLDHYIDHNDTVVTDINDKLENQGERIGNLEGRQTIIEQENDKLLQQGLRDASDTKD